MKKERVRTSRGFKGIRSFIFGWFVGFLCTLLVVAGVGYWAYTSISVRKIEKWTKNDITTNKGIEDLTLKKAVAIISGITSNGSNAYTLNKMEEDFGVKILDDSVFGISTETLKNAPIKDLGQAFNDTINSATFNNIINFMELDEDGLGVLHTVLESKIEYYVNNNKLYKESTHTNEVSFDYEIDGNTLKLPSGTHTIAGGVVSLRLSDIPLDTAMGSISDATKNLQIWELLDYTREGNSPNYIYKDNNVEVSGVMASIAGYTIDELADQNKVNDLKISEIMGYYYNETDQTYYTNRECTTKVDGVMQALSKKDSTIGDLSNKSTFESLKIYEVMEYYFNESNDTYYTTSNFAVGTEVSGVMASIAGKTIGNLSEDGAFDDVLLQDVLGYSVLDDKVMDGSTEIKGVVASLVLKNAKVGNISAKIDELTVGEVLSVDENATGIIAVLKNTTIGGEGDNTLSNKIDNLKVYEVLGYTCSGNETDGYVYSNSDGEVELSGVLLSIAQTNVNQIGARIDELKIYEILGYTCTGNETDGYVYKNSKMEVVNLTGIIKTIAQSDIKSIGSTIDGLHVWEVLGYTQIVDGGTGAISYKNGDTVVTGVLGAIAGSNINEIGTTIDNLKVVDAFGEKDEHDETKYKFSVLNLFTEDELYGNEGLDIEPLTINDLSTRIVTRINEATLEDIVNAGVITGVNTSSSNYASIKGLSIAQVLNMALT